MLSALTLRVIPETGDPYDVGVSPRVQVAFEREYGIGLGKAFDEQRAEYMYWIAWKASKSTVGFDDWLDGLADVEVVSDDDVPLSEGD